MSVLFISLALSAPFKPGADDVRKPWACAIAARLVDDSGRRVGKFSSIIRAHETAPRVDASQTRIHGIGYREPQSGGVSELMALAIVAGLKRHAGGDHPGFAALARHVVCWDKELVKTVIVRALARHGEPANAFVRERLTFHGLQEIARPFCRLPQLEGTEDTSGGYRLPSIDEAAFELADLPVRPLPHAIDDDIKRLRAVFARLRESKAFDLGAAA